MRRLIHSLGLSLFAGGLLLGLFVCPQAPAGAQVTADQEICISLLNKDLAKVADAEGKDILACMRDWANNRLTSGLEDCLTADRKGSTARARTKTDTDFTRRCTGTDSNGDPRFPPFGATDAETVNSAAVDNELALIHAIFGPELDSAIVKREGFYSPRAAACQHKVAKIVMKCRQKRLDEWKRCASERLQNGSISDAETLWSSCLGADPGGRIAKACDPVTGKIRKANISACPPCLVPRAHMFPGCFVSHPTELAECLGFLAECHVCLELAEAGNFDPSVCDAERCAFQSYEICGNLRVVAYEECDDGNLDDGDGCSSDCRCNPATTPDACNLTGDWTVVGLGGDTLTFFEDAAGNLTSDGTMFSYEFTGQGTRSDSCGTGTATISYQGVPVRTMDTRFMVADDCNTVTSVFLDYGWPSSGGDAVFIMERIVSP